MVVVVAAGVNVSQGPDALSFTTKKLAESKEDRL
jgi:hypothetical protein